LSPKTKAIKPKKVSQLSDAIVNKIAAGEVVERPASVVKELTENALDAGATHIEVAVEAGGKNFIQVLDNGHGMGREDAMEAMKRHATSKLQAFDDLDRMSTMGFRGEALPSIASVSRFELRSCTADGKGVHLWVTDGETQDVMDYSGPHGSRIIVRNLFFSTPARRKFLTSNANEMKHIHAWWRRVALAHPQVHLTFVSDGEELHNWPATDLGGRVNQVFGQEMLARLIPIQLGQEGLRVTGFAGKVNTFRRSHGDQYLFVNGRPISNRVINHAVFSAYGHTLKREQIPFYLIFLEVNPAIVDVNVHPAKKEVRFEDERAVHRLVNLAVRGALAKMPVRNFDLNAEGEGVEASLGQARPEGLHKTPSLLPPEKDLVFHSGTKAQSEPNYFGNDASPERALEVNLHPKTHQGSIFRSREHAMASERGLSEYINSARLADQEFGAATQERPSQSLLDEGLLPVFQLHNTYIFVTVDSGVMILDQHVAHERVLYEACLRSIHAGRGASQRLLFPIELDLREEDRLLFEEILGELLSMGFEMQMEGAQVHMTGVPADLTQRHPEGLVQEVLDQYRLYAGQMSDPAEALAASVACKAAIKAGQPLSKVEIQTLLKDLFACQQPFTCPHGRPVVLTLGLQELHHRFDRG
jgi:DNA mismatch repair protein MutL